MGSPFVLMLATHPASAASGGARCSALPASLHSCSGLATEHYEGARSKVAAFINASRPEEVVFNRNATGA